MGWTSFCFLVNTACELDFDYNDTRMDIQGRPCGSLEIMILSYLALIGDTIKFSQMDNVTHLKSATHRRFFRRFSQFGRLKLYPRFVTLPETSEDLMRTMEPFKRAGFPGCVGATDATHISLLACPAKLSNISTGRSGTPTRVFNLTCDFSRRVLHSTHGFYGSYNDKTVVERDTFMLSMKQNTAFPDVEWSTFEADGTEVERKGWLYGICDGGYKNWKTMITNLNHSGVESVESWSNMHESLRKCVEVSVFFSQVFKFILTCMLLFIFYNYLGLPTRNFRCLLTF
jgi:hypothetical protein